MQPSGLSQEIEQGCLLIRELIDGRLTIEELIARWDDLYYAAALDGHESDADGRARLAEMQFAVELLRRVQQDVLDQISPEDAGPAYVAAGRIPKEHARERILEVVCDAAIAEAVRTTRPVGA